MTRKVLVVAAHTDDEVLGCGGTIARHVAEGDRVHAIFIADGVSSRPGAKPSEVMARQEAARQAHEILGISHVDYLDLPDNQLDSLPLLSIIQPLEVLIEKYKPEVVYTHHYGDLNIDHSTTHKAVLTACRPIPGTSVKEIYSFEVLSSTEWNFSSSEVFQPNYFVDISQYLVTKEEALKAYEIEMRRVPHSRSHDHTLILARHRGYSVGLKAAESFIVTRAIW